MGYFPFYMDIAGKQCLIVGGGMIALHKIKVLLPYGPNFHIIAPEISDELVKVVRQEETHFWIEERVAQENDVIGADLVIAASSKSDINHRIARCAKEHKIPVNVVDVKEDCGFIMPAILHYDSFDIAVSSGGRSPAAASYLKSKIKGVIPENYEAIVEGMGQYRDYVKSHISDQMVRAVVYKQLLDAALSEDTCLTDELVERIVKDNQ